MPPPRDFPRGGVFFRKSLAPAPEPESLSPGPWRHSPVPPRPSLDREGTPALAFRWHGLTCPCEKR